MVTFSSNNSFNSGPGKPKKAKRRKKIGKGAFTGKGKYLQNKNKKKKTKITKTKWSELNAKEKIVNIVKGNGKNSGNWGDIKPKVPKIKSNKPVTVPVSVKPTSKEKNTPEYNKDGYVLPQPPTTTKNPGFYKTYEKKQKNKSDTSIQNISKAVDNITNEEGIILPDAIVNTDDKEVNDFINNKIKTHYNPTDPDSEFENKRADTPLTPVEIKSNAVKIANSSTLKTIGDFDPDTDMISIEELEEKDLDLANDISNIQLDLDDKYIEDNDGNITVGGAKVIGIVPSESIETKQIVPIKTNDYNKVIPGVDGEPPRFAEELKEATFENIINQDAKIVAAYPDGKVKILDIPTGSVNILPEIEVVAKKPETVDNIFKRELFFDNVDLNDEFYNPSEESFYPTEEDYDRRENFDQYSDKSFESAVDNLPCEDLMDFARMAGVEGTNNTGFNNSRFKNKGFYFSAKEGRIYSNVSFDIAGRPNTMPVIANAYTGDIMNNNGEPANYINVFEVLPEVDNFLDGLSPLVTLKHTIKAALKGLDMLLKTDCDEVKKFLKENASPYNKDFDKKPEQRIEDLQKRANDISAEVKSLLGDIQNNNIKENFLDNTAKLEVINNTFENEVFPKVADLVELRDDIKDRKSKKKISSKDREEINDLVEIYNGKVIEYKGLMNELTNKPLKELQSNFFNTKGSASTIVKGLNFSMHFPESQLDPNAPALILQENNQDLTISQIAEKNKDLQAKQALKLLEYNEKSKYADTLLNDIEVQLQEAFGDYLKELKDSLNNEEDGDATLAQKLAVLQNRVTSNLTRMIPGLANITLMLTESILRVLQGLAPSDENYVADKLNELNIEISKATEDLIDSLKVKPGLDVEDFNSKEAQILNNTYWQGALLIIDVAMDIATMRGLGVISGLNKTRTITKGSGKVIKIKRTPSNRAISRLKAPWTTKLRLYTANNFPVTVLRIVSERVDEVEKMVSKKGVKITPGQRLSLVLLTSLIESTLDKFGLDMIGTKASPKLVTYLANKLANKGGKETAEQLLTREIKTLISAKAITMVGGTTFNIADEVVQENTTMFIQNVVNNQLNKIGEDILYENPEVFSPDYWEEMKKIAVVSAIGIGTVNLAMNISQSSSSIKDLRDNVDAIRESFDNLQAIRSKEVYNIQLGQLELKLQEDIKSVIDENLSKEDEKNKINDLEQEYNNTKYNLKYLHETFNKIDFELNSEDAYLQFQLEAEKTALNKLLENGVGEVEKRKILKKIENIDAQLDELYERTTDEDGNILPQFKEDIALEFDIEADQFLEKFGEDEEVNIFETIDEAAEYAKEIGTDMGANPGKFFIDKKGNKHFIFSKEGAIRAGKVVFDHEGDHDLVDKLEEEFGADITGQIADAARKAWVDGKIKFKSKDKEKEFEDLMQRYENLLDADKQMLDDEFIANIRDAIRDGNADIDLKNNFKSLITEEVEDATGDVVSMDLTEDTDLLSLLDLMAEDADVAVAIIEESGIVKRDAEDIDVDTEMPELQKDRSSLAEDQAEKSDLIKLINDIRLAGELSTRSSEVSQAQDRIKILNIGIKNAEDVAIIEDSKSTRREKSDATKRLIERNKEKLVNDVVSRKVDKRGYVPLDYIKEKLREEFDNLYVTFFKRDVKYKDVPFGFHVQSNLSKRLPGILDSYDKVSDIDSVPTTPTTDENVVKDIDDKDAANEFIDQNMRTALGIVPGSQLYEEVKEEVKSTFGTKLPPVESGKFKKALQNAFATKLEPKIRSIIKDMGLPLFIDTYGEDVYKALHQDIMNTSFQDFTIKGKRLSKTETDKAMADGKIPMKAKERAADGVYLFEKKPYDKKKFKEYHLNPEKGSVYSKTTQLVKAIAKQLGVDATPEVLQDDDIVNKYNEINKLLGQAEVIAEEVASKISKDPKSRFYLADNDGKLLNDTEAVQNMIIQTASKVLRKGGTLDAYDEEFEKLPEEVVEIANELGMRDLFDSEISGYKAKLKKDLEDDKLPTKYRREIDQYFKNNTKKSDLEVAMKEMDDFNQAVTDKLPGDLIEELGGPLFFHYDYSYLDGGEKGGKGSGVFGPWKESSDKVKAKQNNKSNEKLDFDPRNIEILNAKYGVLSQVETILDKDGLTKEEKYKKLGLNEDGTVKKGSLLDRLQKANQTNKKALNYIMTKYAVTIAEDPSLIPGFLRSMEATTNNTKSYRGLTSLKALEVYAESQATFYNPETNKYKTSLNPEEKKDPNWMINLGHPNYEQAEELALEEISKLGVKKSDPDFEKEFEKKIIKHLNYKGEHVDAAANVMAELAFNVLDAASKLSEAKSDEEYDSILESLKAENELTLMNYDQIHATEVAPATVDEMAGTTNTSKYVRATQAFDLENMLNVDDPSVSVEDAVKESVIEKEAVEKSLKEKLSSKTKNRNSLKKSGVVDMDGDLTGPEVLGKMATLDATLNKARSNKPRKVRKARVFDFDDTLAKTNSKVFYTMPDGVKGVLTAEEFAEKGKDIKEKGGEFDFSDFNRVVDPEEGPMLPLLKKMYKAKGERDFYILTARAPESAPAIQAWLKSENIDMPIENIIGLGNSSEQAKAEWFVGKAAEGYNDFYFSDDVEANTGAVEDVLSVIDVKSKVQQAKARFSLKGEDIANKLFEMVAKRNKKLPAEALKNISQVKATIKGKKIKDPFFQSSSTQNFTGLLYKLLGKGEEGNKDWEFLQDNLVKPYTRALNSLAAVKNTLNADFDATLENFVGKDKPIKNLNDEVPGLGGYTYEDAVRILAWDKQGIKAEGVAKTTLDKIKYLSSKNIAIDQMADQLININKGDGYYYPGEDWRVGTMSTDLQLGISKVKRPKLLSEWSDNIETVFGKDNGTQFKGQLMSAIEATYGIKYREALEDMLRRMRSGRNRRIGNSKLENRFYDWLNNSVGAVMFFNMRSGLLQTLSAANYLNWSFNNPAAAARAFGDQKQFWKDYMYLYNSDFLVDRRGGNKINISEAEIFDATNNQTNKAKAFLNLLIKKGFSITQAADSFAIASGGATYYRNRIKDLTKKGVSQDEAEAQAYEEWTSLSREAQQSSDSMEVSSQQAGGLGRVILAFGNTPMQYNRIIWKGIQDIKDGRGDLKTNLSRIAYYSTLQNLMFNALQQALFAGLDDPEEEWDERKYEVIDGMLNSLMRGMGVSGSIMAAIKDVGLDIYDRTKKPRPEYYKAVFEALNVAPPLDVKVSKFVRGANTYEYNRKSPEMDEYFNIENPSYQAAALVIASTTNIPVDRLLQKMTNIKDAFAQDEENWKRVMLLMGWSSWQLEDANDKASREKQESDKKHYYNALKNPSLYNKNEQIDILKQHGLNDSEINALKKQEDRVKAIIDQENKTGKQFTSKIPNVKTIESSNSSIASQEVAIKNATSGNVLKDIIPEQEETKPYNDAIMLQNVNKTKKQVEKPKSVNFTENTTFKNNRVPVEKRNKQELKLYELPAAEQKDSLKSLGLSDKEIKALKYEGDRVRKILELQK